MGCGSTTFQKLQMPSTKWMSPSLSWAGLNYTFLFPRSFDSHFIETTCGSMWERSNFRGFLGENPKQSCSFTQQSHMAMMSLYIITLLRVLGPPSHAVFHLNSPEDRDFQKEGSASFLKFVVSLRILSVVRTMMPYRNLVIELYSKSSCTLGGKKSLFTEYF